MSRHTDVAREALRRYDLIPLRVRFAAESFNSVFRVTTASAVYALRVGPAPRIHPEGTSVVEAAWHRRLRGQGMHVPDVLANRDGELATLAADDRECVLFEWVSGRSLRARMTGPQSAASAAPAARGPDARQRARLAAARPGAHRLPGHRAGP